MTITYIHEKSKALRSRFKPEEIAHIVDKDGTITRFSVPLGVINGVRPRGHADLVLKEQVQRGSPVVVSSAWNDFSLTVSELKDLRLGNVLLLSDARPQKFVTSGCANPEFEHEEMENLRAHARFTEALGAPESYYEQKAKHNFIEQVGYVMVTKLGNVISCQEYRLADSKERDQAIWIKKKKFVPRDFYSRAKWRSLDFIEGGPVSPKVVCVWEDSPGNLSLFKKRMHLSQWYKEAEEVYLWELSPTNGEIYDEDIVPSLQINRPEEATALDASRWRASVASQSAMVRDGKKDETK